MTLLAAAAGLFAVVTLRGPRAGWPSRSSAAAWRPPTSATTTGCSAASRRSRATAGRCRRRSRGATPLRTLVGLFVDGSYGLLPYAPVFLLGLAGVRRLLAARRPVAVALGAAFVAALLPVLSWRNWWGASPPARFTILLLPTLAVALALRLAQAPRPGPRAVATRPSRRGARPRALHVPRAARDADGERPQRTARRLRRARGRRAALALPAVPQLARGLRGAAVGAAGDARRRVAALWVAAIALLLALDRAARCAATGSTAGSPASRCPLRVSSSLVSLAVDYGARPGGPPRYVPPAPASPADVDRPAP